MEKAKRKKIDKGALLCKLRNSFDQTLMFTNMHRIVNIFSCICGAFKEPRKRSTHEEEKKKAPKKKITTQQKRLRNSQEVE